MIKFRQINHSTVCVTRNTPDGNPYVEKEYSIEDIWINPEAILYLQADNNLASDHREVPLIDGLSQEHSFTKLFISENGFARQLSVVGDPESINEKIEGFFERE